MPGKGKKGLNTLELTDREYQLITNDATFNSWKKLGHIAVVQDASALKKEPEVRFVPPPEPGLAGALEGVNVDEAEVMINTTTDQELLAVWHEKDGRKGVKKAIEARLAELDEEDEEDEEDENLE